jgi:hypothetical protein
VNGVSEIEELHTLLDKEGIHSIQNAMRHKELAKLGDPLTNLLFSLAYSLHSNQFIGEKVSGKILAAALRYANLRHLAPSRLDAHGLGDCVEAMIAYAWLQGFFTISDAATLLREQILRLDPGTRQTKAERLEIIAKTFSIFLHSIWEKEQADTSV